MKKLFKGLFTLTVMMTMLLAVNMVAFADAPEGDAMYDGNTPISSDAPVISKWTDNTITVKTTYNREYLVWALDGTMSTWNVPSASDYANGEFTFKNLTPGMGYRVYARERGNASVGRKAWDQSVNDMPSSYVLLPVRFVGVVKTPDYPNDIESYLPAYVYIYNMETGEQVAPLQTIWNGYFDGYAGCAQGTYKLVAFSSKEPNMMLETTITVPVNEMHEYVMEYKRPRVTEAATEAPTEAPTPAPTEAPTPAPTAAPTQAATQAPTQKATEAPTQKPTQAPAKPTEAATKATEAVTETSAEETTEVTTEAVTEEPTTEAVTEVVTEEPTTEAATEAQTTAVPVPGGSSNSGAVWIVMGVLIGIVAAAGVVLGVKKFSNK